MEQVNDRIALLFLRIFFFVMLSSFFFRLVLLGQIEG